MIVLDTDAFSELMEPEPEPSVRAWINRQDSRQIYITAITLYEVRYGIEILDDGKKRRGLESALLRTMIWPLEQRVLPFAEAAARSAAEITAKRRKAGRPIGMADAQIAGVVKANSAVLVTRNVDDFVGLDLSIVNPWEAA